MDEPYASCQRCWESFLRSNLTSPGGGGGGAPRFWGGGGKPLDLCGDNVRAPYSDIDFEGVEMSAISKQGSIGVWHWEESSMCRYASEYAKMPTTGSFR